MTRAFGYLATILVVLVALAVWRPHLLVVLFVVGLAGLVLQHLWARTRPPIRKILDVGQASG